MKVVRVSGLAEETVAATKRIFFVRKSHGDRLIFRDAAIAQLRRSGWTRQQLEAAFGLQKRQVNQILADLKDFAAAYRVAEEDA